MGSCSPCQETRLRPLGPQVPWCSGRAGQLLASSGQQAASRRTCRCSPDPSKARYVYIQYLGHMWDPWVRFFGRFHSLAVAELKATPGGLGAVACVAKRDPM